MCKTVSTLVTMLSFPELVYFVTGRSCLLTTINHLLIPYPLPLATSSAFALSVSSLGSVFKIPQINEIWCLFFSIWFISLSIITSSALFRVDLLLFMADYICRYIHVYMCAHTHIFSVHPSTEDTRPASTSLLLSNPAMNMGGARYLFESVFLFLSDKDQKLNCWILWYFPFQCLRNFHAVFHSDCTSLPFHTIAFFLFYPAALQPYFIISGSFSVYSVWFATCMVMSFVNRDCFTSSPPIQMHFISLSCLIDVAKTSRTTWTTGGESGHCPSCSWTNGQGFQSFLRSVWWELVHRCPSWGSGSSLLFLRWVFVSWDGVGFHQRVFCA